MTNARGRIARCRIAVIALLAIFAPFDRIGAEPPSPSSEGVTIDPGVALIQEIPIGKREALSRLIGTKLTIANNDKVERTVSFSSHTWSDIYGRPEVVEPPRSEEKHEHKEGEKHEHAETPPPVQGYRPPRQGYADIPNAGWISFSPSELTLAPESRGEVEMFFDVPDEPSHANRHWISIVVARVATKEGAGISFIYDINCFFMLETVPAIVDEKGTSAVGLTVTPSVVGFADLPAGRTEEAKFRIVNNSGKPQDYLLRSLSPPPEIEPDYIRRTRGYDRLPRDSWVVLPERSGEIPPGGSKEIAAKIAIPADESVAGRKYESLILVLSREGGTSFVRLQFGQPPKPPLDLRRPAVASPTPKVDGNGGIGIVAIALAVLGVALLAVLLWRRGGSGTKSAR